jgi:hypothetical protein
MRGNLGGVLALFAAAGLALPVAGQVDTGRPATMGTDARAPHVPYTAEYKSKQVKTLADGSTLTNEWTEMTAVDSQGRHFTSTTTLPRTAEQTPWTHASVFDPVARTRINWSLPGQQATVMTLPRPGAGCATAVGEAGTRPAPRPGFGVTRPIPHQRPEMEDLGTETIQGIEARGRRVTRTTPAGAVGNSEPLVHTTETWSASAPRMGGILVREIVSDPQMGQRNKELVSFSPGEPAPSIFQPPAGFEIVTKDATALGCAKVEGAEPAMVPVEAPQAPEQ